MQCGSVNAINFSIYYPPNGFPRYCVLGLIGLDTFIITIYLSL